MEWNGEGPLARERGLYLDICAGRRAHKFPVTGTPLLMGPVCSLSQGRFEEPVRSLTRRPVDSVSVGMAPLITVNEFVQSSG